MHKLAESILTLFVGSERAVALYGDLLELEPGHRRFWFFYAYVQTVYSLSWRILLALCVGIVGRQVIFNLAGPHFFQVTAPTWHSTDSLDILGHLGRLLLSAVSTIWFIMPFAAVRYGLRDRFVQLSFAVALGTTTAFLFMPEAPIMFAATALVLVGTSLLTKRWRRPALALLVIGIANALLSFVSIPLLTVILHAGSRHPGPISHYLAMIPFRGSLLLLAIACSLLHARLFPPTIARDAKVQ